jgi:ABC-type Mn2+/Zn2+ transport system permease subunit
MRALSTGQSHLEARSVWMFLAGGSLAVVLASGQPRGLEEVQRLQLSSMLGASPYDVVAAAGGLLLTLLLVWRTRHGVLLWATDPVTAQVHGCRLFRCDLAVGLWLGGCLGFAIHATGLLFAFGVTVLPVLLARPLAGSLRAVLFLAPLLSLLVTAGALVGAHLGDLPPGQVAVAGLAALLPLAVLLRQLRRRTVRAGH